MPCTVICVITKYLENTDAKCHLHMKCKECRYEVLSLNYLQVHIETCHVTPMITKYLENPDAKCC